VFASFSGYFPTEEYGGSSLRHSRTWADSPRACQ
jgi:hypothetical protein